MGNWFSIDYSATVGRILMIFFGRPPWNFDSECWKNHSSGTSPRACVQHQHNADFGPNVLRFLRFFFLFSRSNKLQGSISNARGTVETKKHEIQSIIPKFGQYVADVAKKNSAIFVKRLIKPLGKIFRTQKTDCNCFIPLRAKRAWGSKPKCRIFVWILKLKFV